jgi:hypothetical protein
MIYKIIRFTLFIGAIAIFCAHHNYSNVETMITAAAVGIFVL